MESRRSSSIAFSTVLYHQRVGQEPASACLCAGIVADLGGAIDVRTYVGHGTTFTIWLPIAGDVTASSHEAAIKLPHGQGQTVMIVDDEPALVTLAEEILAELGYEPLGFISSRLALQAFREAPQRFDIVLTDETMPELIGTNLLVRFACYGRHTDRADERLQRCATARACGRGRRSRSPAQAAAEQGPR